MTIGKGFLFFYSAKSENDHERLFNISKYLPRLKEASPFARLLRLNPSQRKPFR